MVKYVGVKEWKFFAMVFKNRITKRILGWRSFGKNKGLKCRQISRYEKLYRSSKT
jgi:hypothetical protein